MGKQYVLVIEDNKLLSRIIKDRLEPLIDLELLFAFSYKEAEEILKAKHDQIVLATVDLVLPDALDGEVIELIQKYQIQSIIFTGDFDEAMQDKMMQYDIVSCYCLKENILSIDLAVKKIARLLKNRFVKVLIVDDSKTTVHLYEQMLKRQLLQVLTAPNGKEALQTLKNHNDIKLVLTDYNMPVMDGLELTNKIRESFVPEDLAIIVTSSSDQRRISSKFIKYGANDFIYKPVMYEELATRINMNLNILDMFGQIKDKADKDYMTGLYNRRYFFNEGEIAFNKARKAKENLSIAMFDIDKFKAINDTYGHDVGDVAIIELANTLSKFFNESMIKYILSRFGGEEFCVIFFNEDYEKIVQLLESLRKFIENNIIDLPNINLKYTVSIGACKVEDTTLNEAVKKADLNLYEAKETGRNKVIS